MLSALPPLWDFATSGLETGLTFGWLGGCQWLLARRYADSLGARPRLAPPAVDWLPVVLGLGPLIRPDLALFSAAFLTTQLSLNRPGLLGSTRTIGAALAVPAAYQLFRMAYFAATVPNTALVKEAGRSAPTAAPTGRRPPPGCHPGSADPTRALRNIHQALALTRLHVAIGTVSGNTSGSAVQNPSAPSPTDRVEQQRGQDVGLQP